MLAAFDNREVALLGSVARTELAVVPHPARADERVLAVTEINRVALHVCAL
jgi:hypothetical protein